MKRAILLALIRKGSAIHAVAVGVLGLVGVLVAVLILVGILIAVLVGVAVLSIVLILVLVLVVHFCSSEYLVEAAVPLRLAYPVFQHLSLSLKIRLTRSPEKMAAVMPPAVAFRPPVKIPGKPV